MAVLTGLLLAAALGPIDAPRFAADLDGHAFVASVPDVRLALPLPGGAAIVSNLPVSTAPRPLVGLHGGAYLDDYYYRIHITPSRLDLGNIASAQIMPLWVWNAHFEPRTLTAIDGIAEGVSLTGQPEPPLLYAALQEREYELSVTPDGTPNLDTGLVWEFDSGESSGSQITATRIVAWPFVPDWSEGITERLIWATDIMQSETLAEQRRAIRQAPRREFDAAFHATGRERQYLDLLLYGWSARVWVLPVWPDIQQLPLDLPAGSLSIPCQTADFDFRDGGLALLRGAEAGAVFDIEVVEVAAVAAGGLSLSRVTERDWPRGARLYPARTAQLRQAPSLNRRTDRLDSFDAAFRLSEPSDWPGVAPALTYRNRPLLAARPNESADLTRQFYRLLSELDNGAALPLVTDIGGLALPLLQHRWLGANRAEQAAYRRLLTWLAGRQQALWLPTHAADLSLAAPMPASGVNIDIAYVGYTRFAQNRPGRRDIRIELADGTALHRRITGAMEVNANTERLSLDAAPGVELSTANVARISYLCLCRLDSDSVEIRHQTDSAGVAECELIFRGVRDDEF
jgi:hypothetical protein